MRVLIGYDGSAGADAALDDLQMAGLPPNAEVRIVSVAEMWLPPPPPSAAEIVEPAAECGPRAKLSGVDTKGVIAMEKALALAERARARLKVNFPDWRVAADSSCGSPAWELIFKADQWKPDLVVVGSNGKTALSRLVLGSVSQRVLAEARCSVRVARGRVEEPATAARIIVGVEGSPGSEAAVREVARRFWAAGSEVSFIVIDNRHVPQLVGDLMTPLTLGINQDDQEDSAWAENVLGKAAALMQTAEVKVTTARRVGDPKRELPRAAEEWNADCVFVGATGFSNRLERFVLGTVSAAVAARAHCSVEVVRTPATDDRKASNQEV